MGYESPCGVDTCPAGDKARRAVGRGPQAKHDSAALASPWRSPFTFVTIKAGGSGQLFPNHRLRNQSASHRATP